MSMKLGSSSGTYNVRASELARDKTVKSIKCLVHFLDGTEATFELDKRARGQQLIDKAIEHLELVEKGYFGLQFADTQATTPDTVRWLDPNKMIKKQMRVNPPYKYLFRVKFYVSDPSKLQEEYTRYQFFLQLKKDIKDGKLIVPHKTAVLLASYTLQSEHGDYEPENHCRIEQIFKESKFIPGQNADFEKDVVEMHIQHRGMTPAQAEANYLDCVCRLEMYGIDLFKACWDQNNLDIQLGVSSAGLVVFQNNTKMNTFSWAKIVKISFKRKQFFIQLRRDAGTLEIENIDNLIGFNLVSYRSCKNLWKSCVEHHTFFRLHTPQPPSKKHFFSLGSKFRYSGRTEFQTQEEVKRRPRVERAFSRSPSQHFARRTVGGTTRHVILEERNSIDGLRNEPHSPMEYSNQDQHRQYHHTPGETTGGLGHGGRGGANHGGPGAMGGYTTMPPHRTLTPDRHVKITSSTSYPNSLVHQHGAGGGMDSLAGGGGPNGMPPQLSHNSESSTYMGSGGIPGRPGMMPDNNKRWGGGAASAGGSRASTPQHNHPACAAISSGGNAAAVSSSAGGDMGGGDRLKDRGVEPSLDFSRFKPNNKTYIDEDNNQTNHQPTYDLPPYTDHLMSNGTALPDGHGLVTIRMNPDSKRRFGFNVKGGADQGMPIIVSRVAPNTPADLCIPRLNEGDQVLNINGRDVSQHTHEQIVQFIRASTEMHSGELVLIVRPNVYIGEEITEEPDISYIPDPQQLNSTLPVGMDPLQGSMYMLEQALATEEALTQFEQLYRKKPGMTMNISKASENVSKNRYRDISPYDQTRVIIKSRNGEDYINANYVNMEIPGSGIVNCYIAAQGPLPNTCGDFWQMVWEQQSRLVVMLTTKVEKGRVKCHQYWPQLYETVTYDNLNITCVKEDRTDSFAFREYTLTNSLVEKEERHIKQMQYISWPDHGVPQENTDFLKFVQKVRENREGMVEPTIVHCSAGIGRTGVLITMETAMCLIEAKQPVYPLDIVRQMRDQRAMLIQTSIQYKFVCEAILKVYKEKIVKPIEDYTR